jgi:uncharacterized membrane protein
MLARLLGLDPTTAAGFDPQRVFFARPWAQGVLLALLAAVLLWTAFLYAREGKRASALYKGFLVFLRVAAVATLLLVLAQPMLRLQRVETVPSHVIVLIDRSGSMARRDLWQDPRARARLIQTVGTPNAPRLTRREALDRVLARRDVDLRRRLAERHQVHLYEFGNGVEEVRVSEGSEGEGARGRGGDGAKKPEPPTRPLAPSPIRPVADFAAATRMGDALERALNDLAGQPLSAILLFSDGGQNLGEDPVAVARRARALGVPVYTIGVGDPLPPRDVTVTEVLADGVVRKGDEVIVSVGLKQRGSPRAAHLPVTLRVLEGPLPRGEALASAEGVFAGTQEATTVSLSFVPQQTGTLTLQVSAPPQPGEVSRENNHRTFTVRVVEKKLRILYLEAAPRWEYRYLKNAILRDTSIQFACLLTEADPRLGGEGNVRITGFPRDAAALFRYDIVILGDLPRETFSGEQLTLLRRFVQERGGSLIVIAGERSMPWAYRATPLADILPVVLPEAQEEVRDDEPFRLQLTEEGKRHPMLLLAPSPEASARIWERLPGVYWAGSVPRVKPGATVLAVHPTRRSEHGPLPLLAVQQTGEGRCYLSLVDSTWQWRFRLGDTQFYRYWGQVLRWLAPHELPGENRTVRLTADRSRYALGERVTLRARLLTPEFHPLRVPAVTARVRSREAGPATVRLLARPGAPGLYETEWLPPRAGSFEVSLGARGFSGQGTGDAAEASVRFVVEAVLLEQEKPEMDPALLERVAAAAGGDRVPLEEVARIPERLRDARRQVTSRVEHELWDTPLPLALFCLFLVGEWVLRKRRGLL